MDDKTLFLFGEMRIENGTTIHTSVNPIAARAIIDTLISQLTDGELPHFSVYGQLLTMTEYLAIKE